MKYKVLIIGLGAIGMGYDYYSNNKNFIVTHAKAFSLHKGFNLVGGVDTNIKRATLFKEKYRSFSGDDLAKALKETSPNVVVISNPTNIHLQTIKTIFKNSKPEFILCEKPLAYSIDESQEIIDICKKNSSFLYVNYMRRVEPGVIEIKKRMEIITKSSSFNGVVWYDKGLIHNGSHFSNLLEFWFGKSISHKIIKRYDSINQNDCLIDFQLNFSMGSITFLVLKNSNYSHHEINIFNKSSCVRYEDSGSRIIWQGAEKSKDYFDYSILSKEKEIIPNRLNIVQLLVAENIYKILSGELSSLCNGQEGYETISTLIKIKNQI
tara:strand:+ start:7396 stop:8361 length:966 start_codon:yes stop_codon:yes gene_type:complete